MKKKFFFLSLFLLIASLLSACANKNLDLQHVDTMNVSQLEDVKFDSTTAFRGSAEIGQLRLKALKDTAMSLGAQGGLAWASQKINTQLDRDKKYLETTFNFNAMMLSHGVMPPVLEQGDNSLNLADPNTIRVADKTYKIVKQARFSPTAPNWREYLWLSYAKPQLPDKSLLPKTADEQKAWRQGIHKGWENGISQAASIFQQGLARLKRDFNGMILYRKLLEEKMISAPFVARTELGITGDGEDMRVNDQVLRIVELPKLQTNGRNWRAVVVKQNDD